MSTVASDITHTQKIGPKSMGYLRVWGMKILSQNPYVYVMREIRKKNVSIVNVSMMGVEEPLKVIYSIISTKKVYEFLDTSSKRVGCNAALSRIRLQCLTAALMAVSYLRASLPSSHRK